MRDFREILQETFLFRGLPLPEEALALEPVSFARGAVIYDAAHYLRSLGVVLSGRAEAVAAQGGTVLSSFSPGGVFGAAALFGGGEEYVSRIRAVSECSVLFFSEELLRRWMRAYPLLAENYIAFLSERVRFLNGKIAIFTQDSAEHRLYRWLCANCDETGCMSAKLSMTKLAGSLSIGRTSLYRALEALEKKNLLVRKDGKIEVIQ